MTLSQSGNVLYTYTKRFVCFAESVFSMTRRVIAESVSAASSVFAESEFLSSELFADEAR